MWHHLGSSNLSQITQPTIYGTETKHPHEVITSECVKPFSVWGCFAMQQYITGARHFILGNVKCRKSTGELYTQASLTQAAWNSLTFITSHPFSVLTSVTALTPLHMAFTCVRICLSSEIGSIHFGNHSNRVWHKRVANTYWLNESWLALDGLIKALEIEYSFYFLSSALCRILYMDYFIESPHPMNRSYYYLHFIDRETERLGEVTWGYKCFFKYLCQARQDSRLWQPLNEWSRCSMVHKTPRGLVGWLCHGSTSSVRTNSELQECHGGLCRSCLVQGHPAQGQRGTEI